MNIETALVLIAYVFGGVSGSLVTLFWLFWTKRTEFHTTSYTTTSGRPAAYVNYTFPKGVFNSKVWPFRKAEEVFAKRRGRK
jgi:hypothetical protein